MVERQQKPKTLQRGKAMRERESVACLYNDCIYNLVVRKMLSTTAINIVMFINAIVLSCNVASSLTSSNIHFSNGTDHDHHLVSSSTNVHHHHHWYDMNRRTMVLFIIVFVIVLFVVGFIMLSRMSIDTSLPYEEEPTQHLNSLKYASILNSNL